MSVPDAAITVEPGKVRVGATCFALRVSNEPLVARGRVIHGAWDPLLGRIELFNAGNRSDAELTESLLHELSHAYGEAESTARTTGKQWVIQHAQQVGPLADALRNVAQD